MTAHEMVATVLAALAVPPLPQLVLRGDDLHAGLTSSHDTIAASLINAMRYHSARQHDERRMRQNRAHERFVARFEQIAKNERPQKTPADIYDAFCAYTREYVANFDLQGVGADKALAQNDLRFESYESVRSCRAGDALFDNTYKHLTALSAVVYGQPRLPPPRELSYDSMLREYVALGWVVPDTVL